MRFILIAALSLGFASPALADWQETLDKARGQTVYWNAWGGDARTNAFIAWVGAQTEAQYGVRVEQVKLTDTATAVTQVISEKAAGQDSGGSVDMIWINGPNFLAMKEQGLLHGPFATDLPNAKYLDLGPDAAASVDFTVPVDGYASAWRLARFVFTYDSAVVANPPADMAGFLDYAQANPGRVTHPDVTNFMGSTFLKQALVEFAPDKAALQAPVTDEAFATASTPLWDWYDALRPLMWREGQTFPDNQSVQQQMLNDGEVDFGVSFDPASAAGAIAEGLLPDTARVFVPQGGSIGNISFVAIPYNAANAAGAEVVANFLLDPATQAHQQNIDILGSFSVLDPSKLNTDQVALFAALPASPALPKLHDLGPTLLEPHASWMNKLVDVWADRYTK
ncbi:ABC transporter substrate-binding protein [Pseudorhodobacter turbinis]|uniref:ABC transporter substrate-binding protein n=1 Tax=Pseudorhodobacter turbinis TaxID=2500533 RepID=A0A4P8EGP0_9RHOB|nr:ABC transporter substrate-binding protein [Pseudorhodobacter turbinis]QCO55892.1 ABC transporter substrate-binding protein [Pseudorhodobacter turbinis]